MSSLTPIGLRQTKILFAVGLTNFKIFDIKMLSVFEFRMFESYLFLSVMICISSSILTNRLLDYIKKILKNVCPTLVSIYRKKQTVFYTSLFVKGTPNLVLHNILARRSSNGTCDN